jgi:signal transduction histidine kinase
MRNIDDDVIRRNGMERRNAQLEDLVYSASHSLRSPLLSMLGFTQLLRKDFDHLLDETGRHFTDRIERSARTMDELIEDLLSLCQIRIDENQRATVDSRSLLLRLESDLKARLEDRDIELIIPESCPPLFGDRNRLYQLVSHLMVNAIEHMGKCEIRRIEITVEKLNDDQVLSVRDWGQGIPPGDLEKVFDAFYSKATSASGEKSRGLGLAIVRKIADVHGGRAWAETPIGSGACFRVMLPSR